MGKALYRKYRSKSLSEIIGQDHITHTLEQAIKQGKISHAYLLTGPKGVGKTSVARILAHQINNLPYDDDSSHIDIIEIDAASNTGIDDIRDLREKVYVAPSVAKYKVYIIDEVHMLSKAAFNGLLKTLEEPPEHVVFILATTDSHKVPETITSRTQRFSFKPVKKSEVVKHLEHIAKEEKVKVEPEALELLADHGEGSFRDSISLLDQSRDKDRVLSAKMVRDLLGIPTEQGIDELMLNLSSGDLNSMALAVNELYEQGFQATLIAKQLSNKLRAQMLDGKAKVDPEVALEILTKLIEVPATHDPEKYLELLLLSYTPNKKSNPSKQIAVPDINDEREATSETEPTVEPTEPVPTQKEEGSIKKTKPVQPTDDSWSEVLTTLKNKHNTLYGVIRMASPDFSEKGKLVLSFAFEFHKKRILEAQNQQKLATVVKDIYGSDIKIECAVDKNLKNQPPVSVGVASPVDSATDSANLKTISNIFGGAELLN